MLTPNLYQPIYLALVTILTLVETLKYNKYSNTRLKRHSNDFNVAGIVFAISLAFFIGLRPISARYFVDMYNYWEVYVFQDYAALPSFWETQNFIFDNIFNWLGAERINIYVFFCFMSIVYFGSAYVAMSRMFPNDAFYGFIVFLGAFSTFSYATNGIKAGVAASLFLCALAYRDHKILKYIFLIVSLGFHHSMVLPITAYIVCLIIKNPKYFIVFWLFALIVSILHISYFQTLFAGMADESGANYLTSTSNWGGKTGFRYDFVLYSAFPVLTGWWAIFKCNLQSKSFNFIYNVYLLTNAVWMLCMYASFTNRIAYLSWFMYPIVLVYPYFTKQFIANQYPKLNKVVWAQLGFTLFMSIIYYD